MDYIVTTNKDELVVLSDLDELFFSPGKYINIYENNKFLYINENTLDIIEDLFSKSVEYYDGCQFEYFNNEQVNILENELEKRLMEIKENKEIFGCWLDDEKLNKRHFEILNNNIKQYKSKIIEVLDKLLKWIKLNKNNGITLYWAQIYKLIKNEDELKGGYFEFLIGKFKGNYHNENSVYIDEIFMDFIEDLLVKSNDKFDYYGVIYYDIEQINILENELLKRFTEFRENKELNGNESLNKELKIYKNDIINVFEELIKWINTYKKSGITVLGP